MSIVSHDLPSTAASADPAPEESREELRRRFEAQRMYARTVKEDLERAQRKNLALEYRVQQLETSLLASDATVQSVQEEAGKIKAAVQTQVAETQQRYEAAVERFKVAPQVDRAIRAMVAEVASLRTAAGLPTGPAMTPEQCHNAQVLQLLELLRRAVRDTASHLRSTRSPMHGGHRGDLDNASVAGANNSSSAAAAQHFGASRESLLASAASSPERRGKVTMLESAGGDDATMQALHEDIATLRRREEHTRERCERTADVARRDCAFAKQENRQLIRNLKEANTKLKKREQAEVSALQLERLRREVVEAKRHMKIAVSAKQQEIETLKREQEEQLTGLLAEVERLKRAQAATKGLAAQLETQKERTKSSAEQLTRSGLQSKDGEIKRLNALVEKQRASIDAATVAAENSDRRVNALRRDLATATAQYNQLYAAHALEERQRRETEDDLRRRAVRDVVTSGAAERDELSVLCAKRAEEVAILRRKLNQTLIGVRHEELAERNELAAATAAALSRSAVADHTQHPDEQTSQERARSVLGDTLETSGGGDGAKRRYGADDDAGGDDEPSIIMVDPSTVSMEAMQQTHVASGPYGDGRQSLVREVVVEETPNEMREVSLRAVDAARANSRASTALGDTSTASQRRVRAKRGAVGRPRVATPSGNLAGGSRADRAPKRPASAQL